MTEMQEALGAIAEKIKLAPAKVPEGKVVVAVELDRDERVSGRYMTSVTHGWASTGLAVALDGGRVIAANALFGRWKGGEPAVGPCHKCACRTCGRLVPEPLAVWEAKDVARRSGARDDLDKKRAKDILARFGSCPCGGKWGVDRTAEKAELATFAQKALKALECLEEVPMFLPPRAFTVHEATKAVDIGNEWAWLKEAMAKTGRSALPFAVDATGDAMLYNPGSWLGLADAKKVADTGLFFGVDIGSRGRGFNPAGVDGL